MLAHMDIAAALAQASADLKQPQDLDAALATIAKVACESTPGIDHVGISVAHRGGRIETRAWTDQVVVELDQLQYDTGQGPCLQALETDGVVRVEHARHEQRWPAFIPGAVRLGLRSQLGVRLNSDARTFGALNLYSFSSDTLSDETVQMSELFASHAALAMGHAERIGNLSAALTSRKVIGIALGLLMHRLEIDEPTAFAYLTRMSASTETKLRDVAASVVADHEARFGRGATATGEPEPAGA
ncbi:GAF and ANTAR domain-containing protein [Nocardioides kribbensis]